MPRTITPSTSLDNLKKEAKRWLKALRADDADARERFERAMGTIASGQIRVKPDSTTTIGLRDVQHALAREYGFESWVALKEAVARPAAETPDAEWHPSTREEYERVAEDWVLANDSQDAEALQRLNVHYRRSYTLDNVRAEIWRRVYAFRQRSSRVARNFLDLAEAQMLIAQDAGYGSWAALMRAITTGAPRVPPYGIDVVENRIAPRRQLSDREWDELIGVMKERRITAFEARGLITDSALARIADLPHVTKLGLGGSQELTEAGLQNLARMPQLEYLTLSEYPGGRVTDRALEVLRHLPNLRTFEMTWQRGISDAGVANLKYCDQLERVDLMGSPTGDGAIEALQGKPRLRAFSTGRLVTDAGLKLLHNFPLLKKWHGPAVTTDVKELRETATRLLIDGPFTNQGLASLAGLEGVFDLDLFWHVTGITSDGFAHLAALPNLGSLGCDKNLSDDGAMQHIGQLPRLRALRAQESVATDAGFEALARSKTLEGFWGRVCPNFGNRAFIAFSRMPALRELGVGCQNVGDEALSTLPAFPGLRELTPIGMRDDAFRHIGRCEKLERLTCMYCRETTDAATEFIARLGIKYYYAGLTKITDRSLEILGRMPLLEQIELYECNGVTDAGLVFLAASPRLREVHLDSLPGVTFQGTQVFPSHVRVFYST